ncbi:zeta toxin family protein [Mycolicibacterium sp.]
MVRTTLAALVLGMVAVLVGTAPIGIAEPVTGVNSCQVPPNLVGAQVAGAGETEVSDNSDWLWDAHVAYVDWVLKATPTTEELFKRADGQWEPERLRQQNALLDEYWHLNGGDDMPREGMAIIAGGVSGAGKTTLLEGQPTIRQQRYFVVNPDDMKEAMAARAMIPAIPALSPMEASANAHEEASMLAKRLAERAYRQRTNVIWDITMSSEASVRDRLAALQNAGYGQIDAVFVDTHLQTARQRVMQRWRRGQEKYWAGEGLGGRYVPEDFIDMSKPGKPGFSSRNQEIFYQFRDRFSSTVEYDNSGAAPIQRCVTGPRWR